MLCCTPGSSLSNVSVVSAPAGNEIVAVSNEMFWAVTVDGSAAPLPPPPDSPDAPDVAPVAPPEAPLEPPAPDGPDPPEPPPGAAPSSPATTTVPFMFGCTSQWK